MKSKLKTIMKKLVGYASKIEEVTIKNWLKYLYFRNLIFLVLFPLFVLLTNFYSSMGFFVYLSLLIGGVAFLFLDSNRVKIAQEKPNMLIKTEKIEKFFTALFFVLYGLFLISIYFFLRSLQINNNDQITLNMSLLTASTWTGSLFIFTLNAIESTKMLMDISKKIVKKKYHHRFDFFPSSKMRARARFWVVSKMLNQDLTKETEINSKFPLFLEGTKIYNSYILKKFKFIIKDLKKFYIRARLSTYIEKKRESIISQMDSLVKLMENEKDEPFEFVKLLKSTFNEPTDYDSLIEEFEVEPKPIRNWFLKNSESLSLMLAFVSIIVSIIIAIYL